MPGKLPLEGIIGKRSQSKCEPGMRSSAWLKFKLNQHDEFVIGGFLPGNPIESSPGSVPKIIVHLQAFGLAGPDVQLSPTGCLRARAVTCLAAQ